MFAIFGLAYSIFSTEHHTQTRRCYTSTVFAKRTWVGSVERWQIHQEKICFGKYLVSGKPTFIQITMLGWTYILCLIYRRFLVHHESRHLLIGYNQLPSPQVWNPGPVKILAQFGLSHSCFYSTGTVVVFPHTNEDFFCSCLAWKFVLTNFVGIDNRICSSLNSHVSLEYPSQVKSDSQLLFLFIYLLLFFFFFAITVFSQNKPDAPRTVFSRIWGWVEIKVNHEKPEDLHDNMPFFTH